MNDGYMNAAAIPDAGDDTLRERLPMPADICRCGLPDSCVCSSDYSDEVIQALLRRLQHGQHTGDDTLREWLVNTLVMSPLSDTAGTDLAPFHRTADVLLPRIREHAAAAKQAERKRLATAFDDLGMTYPEDVARGLAIAALITRKSAEADHA